jgi:hypothetical protein
MPFSVSATWGGLPRPYRVAILTIAAISVVVIIMTVSKTKAPPRLQEKAVESKGAEDGTIPALA